MTLSLCTIARDEAEFLPGLFDSICGLVDDLVIGIDDRTTDATEDLAHAAGARTFRFTWSDSFAEARNQTLERARGDWILVLDPDERLLPAGRDAILELLAHDPPLALDGLFTQIVETDLDDRPLAPPEMSSSRLFRNSPDLRYVGRVHEEVRYLPDPPRTWCELLEGGPHIQHYGMAPDVWHARNKTERDTQLLQLRLRDNPLDAVAWCYLALMARHAGRVSEAAEYARLALGCGPRTLHADRVVQMEQLAGVIRSTKLALH